MIVRLASAELETAFGLFTEHLYYDGILESIAIVKGDIANKTDVLCRIHSHSISDHVFNSIESDCREQMEMAQFTIEQKGEGVIIWLNQEGRANGHLAKLVTLKLKKEGLSQSDAYEKLGYRADGRSFTCASEILVDLGIKSIVLLTNNPKKKEDLIRRGLAVSGTQPIHLSPEVDSILWRTYQDKILRGHLINLASNTSQC